MNKKNSECKLLLGNKICRFIKYTTVVMKTFHELDIKEVCNGGVACSLLKLRNLEKTVTASLFHSGLHSSSLFFVKKPTLQELLPA